MLPVSLLGLLSCLTGAVLAVRQGLLEPFTETVYVTQTHVETQTMLAFGGLMHRFVATVDDSKGLTVTTITEVLSATQIVTLATGKGQDCPTVTVHYDPEEEVEKIDGGILVKKGKAEVPFN